MERRRHRQGHHGVGEDGPGPGRCGGTHSWVGPTRLYTGTDRDTPALRYPLPTNSDPNTRAKPNTWGRSRARPHGCPGGYCYTCPYRDTGFNCDTGSHGGRSADRHSGAYSYPSTNRDPGADGNTCADGYSTTDTCTHGHASAYCDAGSYGYSGADGNTYSNAYVDADTNAYCYT